MEPQNQDLTTFDLLLYVPFDLSDVLPVSFQSLSLAFFLRERVLADPLVNSFPLDRSHDLRLLINTCSPLSNPVHTLPALSFIPISAAQVTTFR